MFEKVKHITLSGKEYPYKCDLVVLEKIQEEYSDIGDFENKISGFTPSRNEDGTIERNEEGFMLGTYGIPDLKVACKALCWMIQEGLEIEAEEKKEPVPSISEKEIIRAVDFSPYDLGKILQKEFSRCFARKNDQTT